jgi:hypothetical protein
VSIQATGNSGKETAQGKGEYLRVFANSATWLQYLSPYCIISIFCQEENFRALYRAEFTKESRRTPKGNGALSGSHKEHWAQTDWQC